MCQVPAGREDKRFPEKQGEKVTHMAMTKDFLIYTTARGFVHYFYLKQWSSDVGEWRHDNGANPKPPFTHDCFEVDEPDPKSIPETTSPF